MTHTLKKALSVLLAIVMLLGVMPFAFANETTEQTEETTDLTDETTDLTDETTDLPEETFSDTVTPVVYIDGQTDIIYSDKNDIESDVYYTNTLPEDALSEIAASVSEQLSSALLTSEWDGFCDALFDAISPYISPIKLDENGNVTNSTGFDCLKKETVDEAVYGRYGIYDYKFVYDWRLDPMANAVELDTYITEIKEATGFEKINVIARGLGYSTLLAYLYQFGGDDIKECIIYDAGLTGVDIIGAVFSGQVETDKDALNRYIQENLSDTDMFLALAQYIADIALTNGFADSLLNLTGKIYGIVYENVLPRILLEAYGTMPGYWSMVGDEYYEAAKEFMFSDKSEETEEPETEEKEEFDEEKTDYSVLIKKTDRFHEILKNAKTILEDTRKSGVHIYNIVKYGLQIIPLTDKTDVSSDGIIAIDNATFGTTCAPVGEKLSEEYIAKAKEDGSVLFISPDSETDASTGYLPMHTWYIKNLGHNTNPEFVDTLAVEIFEYDGYTTVFNMEDYSQYLVCSDDASRMENLTETGVITPTVPEEIEELFEFDSPTGIIKKLFTFIAKITTFFRSIISLFTFDT